MIGHRALKRVPLGFNWPLNKTWKGYINPHPEAKNCKECVGTGYNSATRRLVNEYYDHDGFGVRWSYVHGISPSGIETDRPPWMIIGECRAWLNNITQDEVEALVANGRLIGFTHNWNPEVGWQPKRWDTKGYWCPKCHLSCPQLSPEHCNCLCTACNQDMLLLAPDDTRLHTPSAKEVNEWSHTGFGHDSINQWILIETRAKRLGIYGFCPKCRGKGKSKLPRKMKKRYKNWSEYEPPSGEGYQLWETCSEGSPISPVFNDLTILAVWCEMYATIFSEEKLSWQEWLEMFNGDVDLSKASMLVASRNFSGAAHSLIT